MNEIKIESNQIAEISLLSYLNESFNSNKIVWTLVFLGIYFILSNTWKVIRLLYNKLSTKIIKEENCYDIVIEANSLTALEDSRGWNIRYGKGGRDSYNKNKKLKQTVIGVIGNFNKGKSFILQKLSGHVVPQGHSISTKGLSIKYPDMGKTVSIIDSEGFETPIKFLDKENKIEYSDQSIREHLKDRTHSEIFLQKYIIVHSNILLVVVGPLTYSDQKLINRLKSLALTKNLIIVHNLLSFYQTNEVEKYIQNTLQNTFKITKEKFNDSNQGHYWQEKISEEGVEPKKYVTHVVIANDNSQAGDYYNKCTFEFLINTIKSYVDKDIFDPIESLKLNIFKSAQDIFEKETYDLLKDKDSINLKETNNEQKLIIDNCKKVCLTKCYVDEIGTSKFESSIQNFIPDYCMAKLRNNTFEICLDFPDLNEKTLEISKIDINVPDFFKLVIKGEKLNVESEVEHKYNDYRKKGTFTLTLSIPKEGIAFVSFKPNSKLYENGVLKIIYDLIKNDDKDEEQFKPLTKYINK